MRQGIQQIGVEYFSRVARKVFSSWLATVGMHEREVTPRGGLRFHRRNVFLDITYYPEDCPDYSAMVNLGVTDADGASQAEVSFGLWLVIPEDVIERRYSLWTFSSEEEALVVMKRVRDRVVKQYLPPLLDDEKRIRELSEKALRLAGG